MQAVQLDQLLPQIQTLQSAPQDLTSTEGPSFMDYLRSSQEELSNAEEISESEEKVEDTTVASAKTSENESIIDENYAVMASYVQETEQEQPVVVRFQVSDEEKLPVSEETLPEPITEKQIQWLMEPMNKASVEDYVSTEDFAALIEAAEEFIPGTASEEELLEQAQNLAASDPEMFLGKAVEQADADFTLKSDENLLKMKDLQTEKKVTSKDEKKNARIEVTDLRTQKIDKNSSELAVEKTQSKKDFNLTYKRESENSVQVTMDLATVAKQNITSSSSQAAGANGSTFQSMLSNAIQENAPEFVKAGNIVLKDNNQGNINLILHPEKLGNVKIALNLSDKVISGTITVQSKEALEAMRESLASLKAEFVNSGFETGDFNLNLADQSQQFAQNHSQFGQDQQSQFRARSAYSDFSVATTDTESDIEAAYALNSEFSVNIVA